MVVAVPAPPAPPPAVVEVLPPPPPLPVVIEAPLAPVAGDGLVKVHIETKELVTVEHRSGPGAPWQVACETPCDTRLPAADEYRIVGQGLNPSKTFVLTTPKGDTVKVHVAPGLKHREKVGEVLTITGAVVTVGGLIVGLAAASPSSVFQADGTTNMTNWNVIAAGTTVALAGLVTGILGGAWWYDNAHTRVAGDVQGEPPARGGVEPRFQTGLRSATPATGPVYSTTLFSASF
jgi:hypothetical protein